MAVVIVDTAPQNATAKRPLRNSLGSPRRLAPDWSIMPFCRPTVGWESIGTFRRARCWSGGGHRTSVISRMWTSVAVHETPRLSVGEQKDSVSTITQSQDTLANPRGAMSLSYIPTFGMRPAGVFVRRAHVAASPSLRPATGPRRPGPHGAKVPGPVASRTRRQASAHFILRARCPFYGASQRLVPCRPVSLSLCLLMV